MSESLAEYRCNCKCHADGNEDHGECCFVTAAKERDKMTADRHACIAAAVHGSDGKDTYSSVPVMLTAKLHDWCEEFEQAVNAQQTEIERLNKYIDATTKQGVEISEVPCCKCSGLVIEFSIDNESWNTIIRDDGPETDQEYLCLECFAEIAAHKIRGTRQEQKRKSDMDIEIPYVNITQGVPSEIWVAIGRDRYANEYELAIDVAQAVSQRKEAEIDRLQAIIDKLPKTADGVPVTPGMAIWPKLEFFVPNEQGGTVVLCIVDTETGERIMPYDGAAGWQPEKCYSTREAAESTKEQTVIGPQRATPSSVAKIQAEQRQAETLPPSDEDSTPQSNPDWMLLL